MCSSEPGSIKLYDGGIRHYFTHIKCNSHSLLFSRLGYIVVSQDLQWIFSSVPYTKLPFRRLNIAVRSYGPYDTLMAFHSVLSAFFYFVFIPKKKCVQYEDM